MKRYIILITMLVSMMYQGLQAQESATYDYKLPYGDSWFSIPLTANATTATDSIWYFTIWHLTKMPYKYDYKIVLDSIGGTGKSTPIIRQGKKFLSDSWTNIDTVQWKSARDTVKYFSGTSAVNYYKYQRFYMKSANKGFIYKVTEIAGNIWEQ